MTEKPYRPNQAPRAGAASGEAGRPAEVPAEPRRQGDQEQVAGSELGRVSDAAREAPVPSGKAGGNQGRGRGGPGDTKGERFEFNNQHLRFIFVGFLFSFVIREIALVAYELVEAPHLTDVTGTRELARGFISHLANRLPGIMHLLLALFATTMSWVYWARNINKDRRNLDSTFSIQYALLLMDLALVVLYVFAARSAERPEPDTQLLGPLSAVPESSILVGVYFLYIVWDLFHDIFEQRGERWLLRPAVAWAACVRMLASLTCLILATIVVRAALSGGIDCARGVLLLNGAEFANLWVFRALKLVEIPLERTLEQTFQQPWKTYENPKVTGFLGVLAFLAYCVCLASASSGDICKSASKPQSPPPNEESKGRGTDETVDSVLPVVVPEGEGPVVDTRSLRKLFSIRGFASGAAELAEGTGSWASYRDQINGGNCIVLVGGADSEPLSAQIAAKLGSNATLALKRADWVRGKLGLQENDQRTVLVLASGPSHWSSANDRDRRVDVFGCTVELEGDALPDEAEERWR